VGATTRSIPPSPLRAIGPSGLAARGEGRPFIPPATLGGILAHFDKWLFLSGPFYSITSERGTTSIPFSFILGIISLMYLSVEG